MQWDKHGALETSGKIVLMGRVGGLQGVLVHGALGDRQAVLITENSLGHSSLAVEAIVGSSRPLVVSVHI